MPLLAVIPARAGSKAITGKSLRTVGGVPMLLRTLRAVEQSGVAERIVVSTDCPQIASFATLRGYRVIARPAELATDEAPLLPVAKHAVEAQGWTGPVGIFQPTCPLVRAQTLAEAHSTWTWSGNSWAITVSEDPHIHWHQGRPVGSRTNRQYRESVWVESGAAQFASADYLRTGRGSQGTIPIPGREALDIDTPDDLLLAERLGAVRHIHFVVSMGHQLGTGHFHRCISLARALSHHDLSWEWRGDPPAWAIEAVHGLDPVEGEPALTIFDCLAPSQDDLWQARQSGQVVVLEDEGAQSKRYADLLVNDMLDTDDLPYAVLREEFLHLPRREHREQAERVLVTFGGTDPSHLATRCAAILEGLQVQVVGAGADVSMSAAMRGADLVLTSQGRTVFEAAACQTPCISIAANEREARHVTLPGVTYLGLHSTATDAMIDQAVRATLESRQLREEKAQTAAQNLDGRGLDRMVRRIEDLLL